MVGEIYESTFTPGEAQQEAWVLNFGAGVQAAVAYHEMSQILLSPDLFPVPMAPSYCNHVLILRNRLLPVINMSRLLAPIARPDQVHEDEEDDIVGIAVYQTAPNTPLHSVAMHLIELPQSIVVTDEMACEPPSNPLWELFSIACFEYEDRAVPLLDLAVLFSSECREELKSRNII